MTDQDYIDIPIRTAAILTNSFVIGDGSGAENVIGTDTLTPQARLKNQLIIYGVFTLGSLTSCEVRIEFSPDNTTWYRETEDGAVASNLSLASVYDHQLLASANFRLAIPIKDKFIRISANGTGTVTSSSLALVGVVGIA